MTLHMVRFLMIKSLYELINFFILRSITYGDIFDDQNS